MLIRLENIDPIIAQMIWNHAEKKRIDHVRLYPESKWKQWLSFGTQITYPPNIATLLKDYSELLIEIQRHGAVGYFSYAYGAVYYSGDNILYIKEQAPNFDYLYLNCLVAFLNLFAQSQNRYDLDRILMAMNDLVQLGRKHIDSRFQTIEQYKLDNISEFDDKIVRPTEQQLLGLREDFTKYAQLDRNEVDTTAQSLEQQAIRVKTKELDSKKAIKRLMEFNKIQIDIIKSAFSANESSLHAQKVRANMGYAIAFEELIQSITESITEVEKQNRAYEEAVAEVLQVNSLS